MTARDQRLTPIHSLYLVSFVELLMSSINSNLTAYVTSAFYSHGLLGATGIVATIAGGVDVWASLLAYTERCAVGASGFILFLGLNR